MRRTSLRQTHCSPSQPVAKAKLSENDRLREDMDHLDNIAIRSSRRSRTSRTCDPHRPDSSGPAGGPPWWARLAGGTQRHARALLLSGAAARQIDSLSRTDPRQAAREFKTRFKNQGLRHALHARRHALPQVASCVGVAADVAPSAQLGVHVEHGWRGASRPGQADRRRVKMGMHVKAWPNR